MNKPKFFAFALFLICFSSFSNSFAQTENTRQSEPSYEVVLQILIASNNSAAKSNIPANLSETVNKFKKNFTFADYQLLSTNVQRIANTGSLSHKSLLNELSRNSDESVFSKWYLNGLRKETDFKGKNRISFQSFTFDARIPVKTENINQDSRTIPVINYESIGVSLQRFNVPENSPTLIGTLAMPKADEIIFFVLTVKPTE